MAGPENRPAEQPVEPIDFQAAFADPAAVARYVEGPPRFMPGYADLQRMTAVLLAEAVPAEGRILVLGAGGGLELKTLAELQPGWRFDGVDPAAEMLALAERTLGPLADRARLHLGVIDDAPAGPFDGACCLLTLHFLPAEERLRTLRALRARLAPGAPFVAAHCSFPQDGAARALWLDRYAAFAIAAGAPAEMAQGARASIDRMLSMLSPEADEELLRAAGFTGITPFYAAFTWRGWVARA